MFDCGDALKLTAVYRVYSAIELRQQFSNTTPKAAAQAIRQLKRTCLDLLQLRMGQCDHGWNSSHQGVLRPNPQSPRKAIAQKYPANLALR